MKNKSYCLAAFRHIFSDNAQRYRLCCHADEYLDYNEFNSSPFEYFLSDDMETIRENMLDGIPIPACHNCYKMEEAGHKSFRDKWNEGNLSTSVEKVALKLRIFGSYCNLGCYMCHPYNSSTRRAENKAALQLFEDWDVKVKPISTKMFKHTVKDILDNIDLVEHISLTGGEPLQLPRVWDFLFSIPQHKSQHITLFFDTNLTVVPEVKLDYIKERFKQVVFGVSVDHYQDKLAWIRYPIDVQQFESNVNKYKSMIDSLNVTVSLLNINDLDKIQQYYDMKVNWNTVINPTMLSIRNSPRKAEYLSKYKHIDEIVQELEKPSTHEYQKALTYCRALNRDLDFDKVFGDIL